MAHLITRINGKDSFAENIGDGKTAWHGLGQKLTKRMNVEEALVAGGQDFQVAKVPVIVLGKTTDFYATVRMDTKDTFGIVKEQYKVIQNTFAFDFFNEVVEQGEAIIESVGTLGKYGEKTFMLAQLPDKYYLDGTDEHRSYVLLTNDHSGNGNCLILPTDVRVVCWNTMQMALHSAKKDGVIVAKIRHTGDVDQKVRMATDTLNLIRKANDLAQVFNKKLITAKVSTELARQMLNSLLDIRVENKKQEDEINSAVKINQRDSLLNLFTNGTGQDMFPNTGYSYLNAVTEWVDHKKSVRGNDVLSSIFYRGNGFELKQKAINQLQALIS